MTLKLAIQRRDNYNTKEKSNKQTTKHTKDVLTEQKHGLKYIEVKGKRRSKQKNK